jgi:hypothetical protein
MAAGVGVDPPGLPAVGATWLDVGAERVECGDGLGPRCGGADSA